MRAVIYAGDCLEVLEDLADEFVDAVVTDPPYELGFMGRAWDASGIAYNVDLWKQCLRVLKPGGHLLAFGGTRTSHRLTCAIEDAGFEIRDEIAWLYGSGFPKSLDVSKAIDKAAGAEREVIGERKKLQSYGTTDAGSVNEVYGGGPDKGGLQRITAPATDDAKSWAGWGTALKPSHEPIVVARKPLARGATVAANVLTHGTGALNIDACRIDNPGPHGTRGRSKFSGFDDTGREVYGTFTGGVKVPENPAGRWPTNVVLDDVAAAELDEQSGFSVSPKSTGRGAGGQHGAYSPIAAQGRVWAPGDSGGASRFFPVFRYQAKAPTRERPKVDGVAHPTVKPLELMRWLVRLVTPVDGIVLEPFAGSGTTVEAAVLEGMRCIGIEREETYGPLIAERMARAGLVAL